jgi:Flp pilus assembly protein TadB
MDEALGEMSERVGSKNFTFVITGVTIQRQVGGSLAVLFDMVADDRPPAAAVRAQGPRR